jgi:hypothetical protein
VQYGQGRVFVSTYGHHWFGQHDPKGMRCAAFQTIMPRALKWLSGRESEPLVPADFPGPGCHLAAAALNRLSRCARRPPACFVVVRRA